MAFECDSRNNLDLTSQGSVWCAPQAYCRDEGSAVARRNNRHRLPNRRSAQAARSDRVLDQIGAPTEAIGTAVEPRSGGNGNVGDKVSQVLSSRHDQALTHLEADNTAANLKLSSEAEATE